MVKFALHLEQATNFHEDLMKNVPCVTPNRVTHIFVIIC